MSDLVSESKIVAVIGGGPAGLMAAEVLSKGGVRVELYEAKSSVGRKFLVAGKGGLNLTHAEPLEEFLLRYGDRSGQLRSILESFTPSDLRNWCQGLGIETFAGPTGRVFPSDMKANPLLQSWLKRLREQGVRLNTKHRWQGWAKDGSLQFESPDGPLNARADAVVLALGGGSWSKLGSDGLWVDSLRQHGVNVAPLQPSNCGFEVEWSEYVRQRFAGEPLKSVGLKVATSSGDVFERKGACVITHYGLEGSLIYAASAMIREELNARGVATIELDLTPDLSSEQIIKRLLASQKSKSLSSVLKNKLKLTPVAIGLLHEFAENAISDNDHLARAIKALPIRLTSPRPIDEAISTAGGVRLEYLNESLMVTSHPGLFCAGEMLDWEAPTGGYLLTASFATGMVAGQGALQWVNAGDQRDS